MSQMEMVEFRYPQRSGQCDEAVWPVLRFTRSEALTAGPHVSFALLSNMCWECIDIPP